eukprot:477270-Amphidinium_carterae.3
MENVPIKETLRTELVPGVIWGFEQCLALTSVSANIRMTVVKLRLGLSPSQCLCSSTVHTA